MRVSLLIPYYLRWHYGRALKGVADIFLNIVWFLWHFFSIGILSKTLFAPWERLQEKRERGLDIEGFFGTLLINLIMRVVGAIVRLTFISIGLLAIFLTTIVSAVFFCVWLALPVAIAASIIFGIILLVRPS